MILWLDHLIFGNGYGMKSPQADEVFYWSNECLYIWTGWHGCQLQSFQWLLPKPGERRFIAGREFEVFRAKRRWFRVNVTWRMVDMPKDISKANQRIRDLQYSLSHPRFSRSDYKKMEEARAKRLARNS